MREQKRRLRKGGSMGRTHGEAYLYSANKGSTKGHQKRWAQKQEVSQREQSPRSTGMDRGVRWGGREGFKEENKRNWGELPEMASYWGCPALWRGGPLAPDAQDHILLAFVSFRTAFWWQSVHWPGTSSIPFYRNVLTFWLRYCSLCYLVSKRCWDGNVQC